MACWLAGHLDKALNAVASAVLSSYIAITGICSRMETAAYITGGQLRLAGRTRLGITTEILDKGREYPPNDKDRRNHRLSYQAIS